MNPFALHVQKPSAAMVEEKVVQLFDELRIPLLRYLSAFPLPVPDSEDVVQEVFLALFQHFWNGKSHRNVRGWLFRTAHNLALKKYHRTRRNAEIAWPLMHFEERVADCAPNPEDQFAFVQTQKRLLAVVRAMPEKSRWCLHLRAEGLRYRTIAEVLEISLGSVALYLERSLAQIARAAER